jgi:hypothetical protein
MNAKSFLSNLRDNLFGPPMSEPISQVPPTRVFAQMPSVKLPRPADDEPTCFAKGIARSIREEGESAWNSVTCHTTPVVHNAYINHRQLGTTICMRWERGDFRSRNDPRLDGCQYLRSVVSTVLLHSADEHTVAQAIEANPFGAFAGMLKREAEEIERQRKVREHFENLGCPQVPQVPPTP